MNLEKRQRLNLRSYARRTRLSWLQHVEPTTGRTHQIRVHCQYQGHAIVGDDKYSKLQNLRPPKMLLHAQSIQVC